MSPLRFSGSLFATYGVICLLGLTGCLLPTAELVKDESLTAELAVAFSPVACTVPSSFPASALPDYIDTGSSTQLTNFVYHAGTLFLRATKQADWHFSATGVGIYFYKPNGESAPSLALTPSSGAVKCWHQSDTVFSVLIDVGVYKQPSTLATLDLRDSQNIRRLRFGVDAKLPRIWVCNQTTPALCHYFSPFLTDLNQTVLDEQTVEFNIKTEPQWSQSGVRLVGLFITNSNGQAYTKIYRPGSKWVRFSNELEATVWEVNRDEITVQANLRELKPVPLIQGVRYWLRLLVSLPNDYRYIYRLHSVPFTYHGPSDELVYNNPQRLGIGVTLLAPPQF